MIDLWKDLNSHLQVHVDTTLDDSSKEKDRVLLMFTVTNAASPPAHDTPEIRFEEVSIKVGVPPDWHIEQLGTLSPGATKTYEHKCDFFSLPDINYSWKASVSTDAFFRFERPLAFVGSPDSMTAAGYLRFFNESRIHQWLDSTIKSFDLPGPSTTLEEIQSLIGTLDLAVSAMRESELRLNRAASYVKKQDREHVSPHKNLVEEYRNNTIRGIAELKQSLSSTNLKTVSDTLARVEGRLEREEIKINQATEQLMKRYDPQDHDVGYAHRSTA